MNEILKKQYLANFQKIKQHDIKVGQKWRHKQTKDIAEITLIHKDYGWVLTDYDIFRTCKRLKQDLSNINEWELIEGDSNG
jgi:hypothetical protein